MPEDNKQDIGDAFAAKASELLKEFTVRLEQTRADAVRLLEAYHKQDGPSQLRIEYLRIRYENHRQEFFGSQQAFNILVRQASQWMQHGSASPAVRLELEVRLADFERMMQAMHMFFAQHNINP